MLLLSLFTAMLTIGVRSYSLFTCVCQPSKLWPALSLDKVSQQVLNGQSMVEFRKHVPFTSTTSSGPTFHAVLVAEACQQDYGLAASKLDCPWRPAT
jgi:hypothetical protein